jgi:ribose 5-phosphate isomerase B
VRIALGSDHAGYGLKQTLIERLMGVGHEISDLGTDSGAPTDYPPYCVAVGRAVVEGRADAGIVMGGSGQGEQIAANKVHGVRAALCLDEYTARLARLHNDANVLSLGARILGDEFAFEIVETFLATGFEGGRHERRLALISETEQEECRRRGSQEAPR